MPDKNEGRPNFRKSGLTGRWKRIRPDPPKLIAQEDQEKLKKLKKIRESITDLEKVQASRLADMDFCYLMDADATAGMMKLSKKQGMKMRRMAAYRRRLAELRNRHEADVEKALGEDFKRLKMRLSSLVPKSIEVLADQLELNGDLLSLQAAREILDRDGRMPKTSRVQTQVQPASKIPNANDAIMEEFGVKPKSETVN